MWNKELANEYLDAHAGALSSRRCAEHVRKAIEAGGLRLIRHTSAKDYGQSLRAAGFSTIDASLPTTADIALIQPIAGHPHGHIAMYNGTIWVSDFKQMHGLYPGPRYRKLKPAVDIFRYLF